MKMDFRCPRLWAALRASVTTRAVIVSLGLAVTGPAAWANDNWLTLLDFNQEYAVEANLLPGAESISLSQDGKNVYVVSFSLHSLAVYDRNAATGLLTFKELHRNGLAGVDGMYQPFSVAVSNDGSNVYVTGSSVAGTSKHVADFGRNPFTGELSYLGLTPGAFAQLGARPLKASSDNANVYLTTNSGMSVAVFQRDQQSGALSVLEYESALGAPIDIELSPDGAFAYVVKSKDHAIAVFERSLADGTLEFVGQAQEGVAGVQGIYDTVEDSIISPGGEHLYALNPDNESISVFEIDKVTGQLSFMQIYVESDLSDRQYGGLGYAKRMAISPDGRVVYVAGAYPEMRVLRRNEKTGELTFLEDFDEAGTFGTLCAAAVSSDGKHLYASARGEGGIAVYEIADWIYQNGFE